MTKGRKIYNKNIIFFHYNIKDSTHKALALFCGVEINLLLCFARMVALERAEHFFCCQLCAICGSSIVSWHKNTQKSSAQFFFFFFFSFSNCCSTFRSLWLFVPLYTCIHTQLSFCIQDICNPPQSGRGFVAFHRFL